MNTDLEITITRVLSEHPGPISIDSFSASMPEGISLRTLQRKLEEMIKQGRVEREGKARATRYRLAQRTVDYRDKWPDYRVIDSEPDAIRLNEDSPSYNAPELGAQDNVELSPESKHLRDIIRQPQGLRDSSGYRRTFLDAYTPNKTEYLPQTLRQHLHQLGQSDYMAAMPPGTYARQVLDRLIIDLTWNSSRLEGSTYSLLETDRLLILGKALDPNRAIEAQMILNHKAAIEFLVEEPNELGFNRYTMLNLHAILTEGLLKNPNSEGALRTIPVGVGGTVYHPTSNPALIEECFDLILKKASAIKDPLECSFFLMVHLPYLQPFEDGNKRTSRLSANFPLIQKNMAPLSFVDVPVRDYTDGILTVYELNRVEVLRDVFAHAYERSAGRYAAVRQEMGDPDPVSVRYRMEIKDRIRDVVVQRMDKLTAAAALRRWANQNITASDRAHFIELTEGRLLGLREGNLARVRLRPSEFAAWWPVWTRV